MSETLRTQDLPDLLETTTGTRNAPVYDISIERTLFGTRFQVLGSVAEAAERIADLVGRGSAASVFTCNVDHVMLMRKHERFRRAYARSTFVTADGAPIVATAKLAGQPIGVRVTGADLVPALARTAAARSLRVALVGGAEGVGAEAGRRLQADNPGLDIVLTASPAMGFQDGDAADEQLMDQLRAARPDLVIVCFGAPRQELWIDAHAWQLPGAVFLGAGASLDFVAGRQRRAPALVQRLGVEWMHRLFTDFGRLWRRYLVQDSQFAVVAARELVRQRAAA
jgi:N-acetylglucosaminyldiphosphoundecaprenol N-acetyl-beta-D-mannosaminyltransferase